MNSFLNLSGRLNYIYIFAIASVSIQCHISNSEAFTESILLDQMFNMELFSFMNPIIWQFL